MPEELWNRDDIAAFLGVGLGSVRQAVRRMGLTPTYKPGPNGRPMAYYAATAVRDAAARRPGPGARTDRHPE